MNYLIGQQFPVIRMPSTSSLAHISQLQPIQVGPMSVASMSPVSPISPIIPATQLKFYDGRTGEAGPVVNLFDRTTQIYNSNGMSVELTGSQQNVQKAIALMRINEIHQPFENDSNGKIEKYIIDEDVSSLLGADDNQVSHQQVLQQNLPQNLQLSGIQQMQPIQPFNQLGQQVQNWAFVPNPFNQTKVLLAHPSLQKPFSGSGVIFFERNYQNGGKVEPSVILVRTTRGTFEDFGGEMSNTLPPSADTIKHNARKEVFEESQALFAIQNMDLDRRMANGEQLFNDMIDIQSNATYRCYYVALSGTEQYPLNQLYASNKAIILTKIPNLKNDWRETIELKRFFLSSIRTAVNSTPHGGLICNDVNGIASTIRDRTANSLRALLRNDQLLQTVFANPVPVNYTKDNSVYSQTYGLVRFNF